MLSHLVLALKGPVKQSFALPLYTRFLFPLRLPCGHPRCSITDVPPQPNSPPDSVPRQGPVHTDKC